MGKIIIASVFCLAWCGGMVRGADNEESVLRTKDPKSQQARNFLEALTKGDSKVIEAMLAEDVGGACFGEFVNGREPYMKRLKLVREGLFRDMRFRWASVHTNYFTLDAIAPSQNILSTETYQEAGDMMAPIWTNIWTSFEAVGRSSKESVSIPMHIDFRWQDDKIKLILMYYGDSASLKKEIAAYQLSKR
ncbi:MAG: hypothetical protein P8N76_18885 [Pirellulaceae bacterium]|nr:hypothetical protein [Pirellulaceae bacterium]